MKIYYLVYKLTNLVNNKIYIGCHMTKNLDDNYMGSGKRLGYAKKKYGIENFKKEILSIHETPEEMLAEEARLVNDELLKRDDVYNLVCGGKGSFRGPNGEWIGKSNWHKANPTEALKKKMLDPIFRAKYSNARSIAMKKQLAISNHWLGKTHSESSKLLMCKVMKGKQSGSKNSQFGSCWITKDLISKKIKIENLQEFLNSGWERGRKTNS